MPMEIKMPKINRVVISGHTTSKPELTVLNNGTKVTSFNIAYNERYKDKNTGEWKDIPTTFIAVVAWRNLAEAMCNRLHKGSPVIVEGKLQLKKWKSRSGESRERIEIVASSIQAIERRSGDNEPPDDSYNNDPEAADYESDGEQYTDDIPF